MSNAKIEDGLWRRRVKATWRNAQGWRTDMFKSVLADPRLKVAEFILECGPTVRVPKEELERVLVGSSDHYEGKIWGPFNIDPQHSMVAGQRVKMTLVVQPRAPQDARGQCGARR